MSVLIVLATIGGYFGIGMALALDVFKTLHRAWLKKYRPRERAYLTDDSLFMAGLCLFFWPLYIPAMALWNTFQRAGERIEAIMEEELEEKRRSLETWNGLLMDPSQSPEIRQAAREMTDKLRREL